MHEQPHVAIDPQFQPNDPQIQVFMRDGPTSTQRTPPHLDKDSSIEGETQGLSIEYDVFACDAFVEDVGRWIRLMPDATFIPS